MIVDSIWYNIYKDTKNTTLLLWKYLEETHMFQIDRNNNQVKALEKKTFMELSFSEKGHLQEWIDKDSSILGENLLIIQKEFAGFTDTLERLDLLAVDKAGRLVLVENKLDDSGKDVTWQALKYVSYCASLSKSEIQNIYQQYLDKYKGGGDAKELLTEFLEKEDFGEVTINSNEHDQRIILVAANFRKEVTSTVLWLQNHNVDIKCIRVTPYQMEGELLLDSEQILPPPDTEDYQIKLGIKKHEESMIKEVVSERDAMRKSFWAEALPKLVEATDIYHNVSPTKDNWIVGASGHTGVSYNAIILLNGARAEVNISRASAEENKSIFDFLYKQKEQLDAEFGTGLKWERVDHKTLSKISISTNDIKLMNKSDWDRAIQFLSHNIFLLKKLFQKPIEKAVQILNK